MKIPRDAFEQQWIELRLKYRFQEYLGMVVNSDSHRYTMRDLMYLFPHQYKAWRVAYMLTDGEDPNEIMEGLGRRPWR